MKIKWNNAYIKAYSFIEYTFELGTYQEGLEFNEIAAKTVITYLGLDSAEIVE
jgi:hypothetical protein